MGASTGHYTAFDAFLDRIIDGRSPEQFQRDTAISPATVEAWRNGQILQGEGLISLMALTDLSEAKIRAMHASSAQLDQEMQNAFARPLAG